MITKAQLYDSLDKLPDEITIDQLVEHAIFIEKVNKGLKDSEEGLVYTKEEARERLGKWLK